MDLGKLLKSHILVLLAMFHVSVVVAFMNAWFYFKDGSLMSLIAAACGLTAGLYLGNVTYKLFRLYTIYKKFKNSTFKV